jgi:hypothetical protein
MRGMFLVQVSVFDRNLGDSDRGHLRFSKGFDGQYLPRVALHLKDSHQG